jgi:hypothetical protein
MRGTMIEKEVEIRTSNPSNKSKWMRINANKWGKTAKTFLLREKIVNTKKA